MTSSIVPIRHSEGLAKRPLFSAWYRKAVLKRLQRLNDGHLRIVEEGSAQSFGDLSLDPITLRVHSPRFWREMALGGGVGAGEAYIMGWWSCSDLVGLIRLLCRNRQVLSQLEGGMAWLSKPIHALAHYLHRNTRSGAARNISAHYDLGNDFFALMLDETMMYSAAYYPRAESTLLEAQICKMQVLARKLDLQPEDHLLEIGSGWGAMAIHAARNFGCRVTTTTISKEQYTLCKERVTAAGLSDRVEVLFCDYRDLHGQYDKIISIEMIEAIGHRQYPIFFQRCMELLKPQGLALVQAITIADQEYDRAKRHIDYIKRYIFPGSCIPSLTALQQAMSKASDLRMVDMEDVTHHYVRTLADWRLRCQHFRKDIRALGKDVYFERLWEFYLCYCEGGFAERAIGDVHLLLARPDWRPNLGAEAA
ncbi:MAG: class I SAM-dependent methyltransferase [Planctomycetota bacterium]|nr:MAG: class I SAM-dependent methyltransferase [Planctomycetota bacterium]